MTKVSRKAMRREERFGLKTSRPQISHNHMGAGGKPVTDGIFPLIPKSQDPALKANSLLYQQTG
jgi:hypothetical protein